MPELDEALQRALGPDITVERSLGGGMSRVYLARDATLDRRVVVKLLASDIASGVSAERFSREIRLLAHLQHPHIVPVLSAGVALGVPYYVMPYLEGDSLATRLERERELPVPMVEQVLREVLDALAYAHSLGIVHRDIKPDNVLLAGGHAVLTDFGIARALAQATADHRLTTTGMALGTPAYMAPEQIAAEPTVDHRADLYAVGAMAFQLLTGTPPFSAATTQALFLQHMSQPAPLVTSRRPATPAYLRDFIARCLEKSPADRYQSAVEALAVLGGGTHTTPASTSLSPPARPLSVALLRATVAMLLALGVTAGAIRIFALPDWVFTAALGVAGVIVGLAFVANRYEHAHARTGVATGGAPPLTRQRVRRAGLAAFATLGAGAALFMASRATGIGPGATLLSDGTLAPRDRLVVADVEGAPTDSVLPAVSQLLRIALAQSSAISILDGERLAEALSRMQREPSARVTADIAHEVATRLGLKAYVVSTLVRAGSGWLLAASVVRTSDREPLLQVREPIASPDALIGGVDRLAARLREQVGESLRTVRADKPLEDITTRSLTALRFYADAQRVANRSDERDAIALLDRAIDADPGFAMAWRQKGAYLSNSRETAQRSMLADSALRMAFALREKLPTRERLLVEATVASGFDNRLDDAINIYKSLLARFPDDLIAQNNLSATLSRAGRRLDALAVTRQSLRDGTATSLTYQNALMGESGRENRAVADSIDAEFARAFPVASDRVLALAEVAGDRIDEQAIDSLAAHLDDYTSAARLSIRNSQATIAALHGKLNAADRYVRDAILARAAISGSNDVEMAVERIVANTTFGIDVIRDTAAALANMRAAWLAYRVGLGDRAPGVRLGNGVARVLARLGDAAGARAIHDPMMKRAAQRGYPAVGAKAQDLTTKAVILLSTHQYDAALRELHDACELMRDGYAVCAKNATLEIAQAYDGAGQRDSAAAVYRRFLNLRAARRIGPIGSLDVATPRLAFAARRLGALLDAKGDTAGAIEAYGRFVDLWRDADPTLQPIVRRVSDRMKALRAPQRSGG